MTIVPQYTKPSFYRYTYNAGGALVSKSLSSVVLVQNDLPITGSAPEINGWRKPTPYRGYAIRTYSLPYDHKSLLTKNRFVGELSPYPSGWSNTMGTWGASLRPRTSTSAVNRSITEALNKVSDVGAKFAESLATMGQTVSMLIGLVSRLLRAIKFARKGNWALAQRALFADSRRDVHDIYRVPPRKQYARGVSSLWLEWIYGWYPLIQDIGAGVELLKTQAKRPFHLSVTRTISEEESPPTPSLLNGVWSGSIKSGAKTRLDVLLTNPNLALLNGLGFLNPAALAWELIPWSFIIDWVVPIGNCLTGLTANFGVTFLGGSTTTWTKAECECRYFYAYSCVGSPVSVALKSMTMERVVHLSMPLPRLYVKSPFSSSTRAATALSLFISRR